MLIAIAIAEEIQWFQRKSMIGLVPKPSWPTEDLLGRGAPHEPIFVGDLLRLPSGLLPGALGKSLMLRFEILLFFHFGHGASEGAWDHQSSCVTLNPRRPSAEFSHQCNPLILGSSLQWRWQWASIGHFVFLFNFGPSSFFLKISLLEMLIAFGNEHCFWWFKNLYQA